MLMISILKREGLDCGTTINVAIVGIVATPKNVFENAHLFTQYFNGGLSAIVYFGLLKNVMSTIRKFKKFLQEIYKMDLIK